MKISLNWLRDYLKVELPAEKISEILTDIGLEVESLAKIETIRGGLEGVVIGHILTCEKHPDADKLRVTTVDIGDGEPKQIVCGAPNVATGQKVMVAMINCTLYPTGQEEGLKIKKSKIRGVESSGMICAEDELGIGESHEGIIVLPADAAARTPAGTSAREFYNIQDDYIFEIGLTPNRIDASSHYGVTRDLAAYLKANSIPYELSLPPVDKFKPSAEKSYITVEVQNSEAAPRYMGVTIRDIKVATSPEWLQARLRAIGMTPKNNVVDITNYILHELGQPLHAFDAGKIKGGKVVVRTCPEGTKFTTLDGVERKLSSQDLMICDGESPMCIAGVFGGIGSGVTENTTEIFLESAYFNPVWVRKTAKRHGLNTDASFRYERGTDPDMPPFALYRAALLMQELAGGVIMSPVTDIYPVKSEPFRFRFSPDRARRLIGKDIPDETIKTIIGALDIKIEDEKDGALYVAVPPYRVDVQREADLIEDVLRIYGYNNIGIPQHLNSTITYAPKFDTAKITNIISDLLTASGFTEIMSNSLTKATYYADLTSLPAERCVKILNPLSNDLNVMRQTLMFSALEAIQLNTNHRNPDLKLYEFGNCYYYKPRNGDSNPLDSYIEKYRLGLAVTGMDHAPSWNIKSGRTNFFTLKAVAEKIMMRVGIDPYAAKMETLQSDLYSEAVTISVGGKVIAELGVVSKRLLSQFDIKTEVYFMEADFTSFVKIASRQQLTVKELSKFPEVRRDLALLVDTGVTFSQLREIALAAEKKLLRDITLFDVYEGDKLPDGKKSYALGFVLEDTTQTMTDGAIDRVMSNLITAFRNKAGAQIR